MAVFAVCLAQVLLVLGVGYGLQMLGVPAGIDAAAVMEFLAFWDRTTAVLDCCSAWSS
jgi:hypothetical protein